jgi:hypothetical protein
LIFDWAAISKPERAERISKPTTFSADLIRLSLEILPRRV